MTVCGRNCTVYHGANPRSILIQPTGAHEQSALDAEVDLIAQRCGNGFLFASFPVADWNRELSPWEAPPVFGREGFGHGAADTLAFIERELLPAVQRQFALPEALPVILGGYSLAGLFSLWSAYQADRFSAVAAASPSVWFPGWIEYAQRETIRAQHVYIHAQEQRLREQGIDCTLEWNEGNHFRDAEKRTAAAFAWCVERLPHGGDNADQKSAVFQAQSDTRIRF